MGAVRLYLASPFGQEAPSLLFPSVCKPLFFFFFKLFILIGG